MGVIQGVLNETHRQSMAGRKRRPSLVSRSGIMATWWTIEMKSDQEQCETLKQLAKDPETQSPKSEIDGIALLLRFL